MRAWTLPSGAWHTIVDLEDPDWACCIECYSPTSILSVFAVATNHADNVDLCLERVGGCDETETAPDDTDICP